MRLTTSDTVSLQQPTKQTCKYQLQAPGKIHSQINQDFLCVLRLITSVGREKFKMFLNKLQLNYTVVYSATTHSLTKLHKILFITICLKLILSYPQYKIWRSSRSYCLSLNTWDEIQRKGILLPGKSITV